MKFENISHGADVVFTIDDSELSQKELDKRRLQEKFNPGNTYEQTILTLDPDNPADRSYITIKRR